MMESSNGKSTIELQIDSALDESGRDKLERTDLLNGRRFAREYRREVRWCPSLGRLKYNGMRWARVSKDGDMLIPLVEQMLRGMLVDAAQIVNSERREAQLKFIIASAKLPRALATLTAAKAHLSINVSELDTKPYLLNVQNGTVDLKTRRLRKHNPDDFLTQITPGAYDRRAKCPLWLKSLREIFGTQVMVAYMQRHIGYAASGDVSEQDLLILWGIGGNGKKIVDNLVAAALGPDYCDFARAELLIEHHDDNRADYLALHNRRYVVINELSDKHKLNEAAAKRLTGDEPLPARYLYLEKFTFRPTHHMTLASNYKPTISGQDEGIWRRLRLVALKTIFRGPDDPPRPIPSDCRVLPKDVDLENKLKAELTGILTWIVDGAYDYFSKGMREPSGVRLATEEYRAEENTIEQYIEERCETGEKLWIAVKELTADFNDWLRGREQKACSEKTVGDRFVLAGYTRAKQGKDGQSVRRGLQLKLNPQVEMRQTASFQTFVKDLCETGADYSVSRRDLTRAMGDWLADRSLARWSEATVITLALKANLKLKIADGRPRTLVGLRVNKTED